MSNAQIRQWDRLTACLGIGGLSLILLGLIYRLDKVEARLAQVEARTICAYPIER